MRTLRLGSPTDAGFDATWRLAAPGQRDRLADARPGRPVPRVGRARPASSASPWGPGWALVGDAGYYKDPISAHGMTDALRDAELLADAVLAALGGGRTERRRSAEYRMRPRPAVRTVSSTSPTRSRRTPGTAPRSGRCCARMSSAMTDEVELLESRCQPARNSGDVRRTSLR